MQREAEEARPSSATHKVQLTQEQAKQLEERGVHAELIGDYGAFKVMKVDEQVLATLPAEAQRDDYNQILLNAGVIDTASAHGQSLRGIKQDATGKRLHIVQFNGPIKPEWVTELESTGVKVVTYIPNNAYIVYGDAQAMTGLQREVTAANSFIQWDGAYLDDYKLNPAINTVKTKTYAIQLVKDAEANGPTLDLIRNLESRNGTIREVLDYVNVVADLKEKDLYEIATRPDVLSIMPRPTPKKLDERQDMIISGNLNGNLPTGPGYLQWLANKGFTQAQFTASGFGVDVSDSGMDNGTQTPNHFGLYTGGSYSSPSRVVYNRLEGTPNSGSTIQGCDGHGNLNTHIVAGYSNKTAAPFTDTTGFTHGLGVAPFVKVGSSVVFDPDTFTDPVYADLQSRAYRDGMRISTNSWGASSNLYDADAQAYDALVRDAQPSGSAVPNAGNQEMVIVFAAGNSGSAANTVGTPGTAKNIITVGASENVRAFGAADLCGIADTGADSANDIISFSSRGPASDGRKKPEIVAPGTHVSGGVAQVDTQRSDTPANPNGQALSCFDAGGVCGGPNNNFYPVGQQWYTASSGTSHSTPAVAGGAALVRQYFINQNVAPPSAAMTKAYLMNSARYMTGVGANDSLWSNSQGMGLMDLGMAFDGIPRLLDDENPASLFTATGQTRTFSGVVADSNKPFRVTLAWTDAPGATSGSAWKNNLDLSVTVGGNTYKGNVFTGANSVVGGTADASNNAESVFLPAGTTGAYTVTVTAANINSDGVPGNSSALDQDFALVAYNSCTAAAPPVSGTTAVANGNNQIDVSWAPNGSASYNIYRSTTAGGPYTRVNQQPVTSSPYQDKGVSGSTTYYYVVRAVQCAESVNSNEASATATGLCKLPPTFAGLTNANNGAQSTCTDTLTWAAATPICGGTLSYSVYRSTTPGFTPSIANKIATGITSTSFNDNLNVAMGSTYYYVVRATETSNATNEDTNTVQKSASPTGTITPGVNYFDDFDGNRPANASSYWIATTQSGTSGTINLTSGCHYQSANTSYRWGAAATTCGGTYPVSTTATLSLGGSGAVAGINGFSIPSTANNNPSMTFNLWYIIESGYDGAWLVYSTTGSAGPWTNVGDSVSTTAPYITAGGYDGTLNSSTTTRIWTGAPAAAGGANGALKPVTVNLSPIVGQKVWFGFKFSADFTVNKEGFYVDDVRILAQTYQTCSTNTPPPGPAVSYTLSGLPATIGAGAPVSLTLTALDSVGQTATGYNGTATITSTDAQAQLPANVSFTAGVASGVNLSFRTLGTQSITVTDTATPAITASGSTSVTPGAPAALKFLTQPAASTKAGNTFSPAVGLTDQFGNAITTGNIPVTIALGANPGNGTLSGVTTVSAVNGVATFNLSLDKVAQGYTLVASSPGLTGATSAAFDIIPGVPAQLAILTQPSTAQAGAAINPAVQVILLDKFGNTTNGNDFVSVGVSTNPTGDRPSGTLTVPAVNGVATFSDLSFQKVGSGYTLEAAANALTSVISDPFDITPADPYSVVITRQPSSIVAGATITPSVSVTLLDAFGNVATQATNSVAVSLGNNPTGASLLGTTTVATSKGEATFDDLTVDRVGANYTLVVGSEGLFTATSVAFNVTVGSAAQLAFTSAPTGNVGSNSPFTVKVTVRDASGNVITNATAPVTLSLANAQGATLSGTLTANPVNGVATFTGLTVDKAGTGYTLQADAPGLTSATSSAFGVTAGSATKLAFLSQPLNGTAGAALAPAIRVAVLDAQGNTVQANATISLALASNAAGGTLGGTKTVNAINGVATFDELTIARAATGYQLVAHTASLTDATSVAFDIAPAAKAALAFTVQPGSAQAGAVISPAVRVSILDGFGNVVANATDAVTVAIGNNPRNGTLSGTKTVNAINGVATFAGLSINRNGKGYTLAASAGSLAGATSSAFDITPGNAPKLVFHTTQTQVAAGETLTSIEVELQDDTGQVFTASTDTVTLSLGDNAAGGQLYGTLSAPAVNGVATFDGLSLRKAGNGYTLVASAQGFAGATSTAFTVAPGAPASYALSLVPSITAGQEASLSVKAYDAYGNLASNYGGAAKVTSSDAKATYAANAQFVEGVLQGFKVMFKSPGLRSITVTDSEKATLTSTVELNVTAFAQPTVTVTDPAGGTTVSGKVSISVKGAVAPGTTLDKLSILVDGVEIASGSDETVSGSWDSSKAQSGSHIITAVITDGAGNMAASAPVVVSIDGGCGCGATSNTEAGVYLGLLVLAWYALGRRRAKVA
ncbi:MAG: S8 family serine peptidase [Hyalangium sp.]|uniref:S8 family serine peptidase n=1 Tax=Hyalangium sp. TaxID=2028555 RepID=UPI00389A6EAF